MSDQNHKNHTTNNKYELTSDNGGANCNFNFAAWSCFRCSLSAERQEYLQSFLAEADFAARRHLRLLSFEEESEDGDGNDDVAECGPPKRPLTDQTGADEVSLQVATKEGEIITGGMRGSYVVAFCVLAIFPKIRGGSR